MHISFPFSRSRQTKIFLILFCQYRTYNRFFFLLLTQMPSSNKRSQWFFSFVLGSISNIDVGAEYHCNKTQVRKVISGVVGAASSVTSIQVANLLRLFRIPQVSYRIELNQIFATNSPINCFKSYHWTAIRVVCICMRAASELNLLATSPNNILRV